MGLLTLVGDLKEISVVGLVRNYGESIGGDISSLVTELKREIAAMQNHDYAIPLDLRLTFSRSEAVGDIQLIKATEAPEGGVGYVIEKPVDLDRSHPHLTKEIVPLIDKALRDALQPDEIRSRLRGGEHKQRPGTFTTNDFQAVLAKEGWRESNNEFHHKLKKPETHRYSQSLVREVVKLIELDPTYLMRALESYRNRRK